MDYLSLATFVLITTFTPGPNNISCASMGILAGYRKTLPYIGGICAVFFLVMLLCNQFAHVLLALFPAFEAIIHIASAVYILWLAYHTARASYTFDEGDQDLLGFWRGFFLQILNPKALAFGLTIYGTFLAGAMSPVVLAASAAVLAAMVFCAVTTWTLFGTFIRSTLKRPGLKRAFNLVLSLLLVYTAVEISGFFF